MQNDLKCFSFHTTGFYVNLEWEQCYKKYVVLVKRVKPKTGSWKILKHTGGTKQWFGIISLMSDSDDHC